MRNFLRTLNVSFLSKQIGQYPIFDHLYQKVKSAQSFVCCVITKYPINAEYMVLIRAYLVQRSVSRKADTMLDNENDPFLILPSNGVPKRELLEKDIESAVCRYAKKKGMLHDKFSSPGKRSVPDQLFTNKNGFMFFIEFKAPGKKATPKQVSDHNKRRAKGVSVYVVDNIDEGKSIIDEHIDTWRTHDPET